MKQVLSDNIPYIKHVNSASVVWFDVPIVSQETWYNFSLPIWWIHYSILTWNG